MPDSTLEYIHIEEMRKLIPLRRKGISLNLSRRALSYAVKNTTINSLSLCTRNVIKIELFYENNNIKIVFATITSAAKHYDVDPSTITKYIKQRFSLNNLRFEARFKDVRIWVFDIQCFIIGVFSTVNKLLFLVVHLM